MYRLEGALYRILGISVLLCLATSSVVSAHRSGCHRWHSCPSDHGTYTCGDLGYCSGCPDNQYCLQGSPRKRELSPSPSSASQQPIPEGRGMVPGTASSSARPAQTPLAPQGPQAPAVRQDVHTRREEGQSLQELERGAEAHTQQVQCEREYARYGQERVEQCQWDFYERRLLAHCRQVAPQAIHQCMYAELVRQDTEHAHQRAEKYARPHAPR